MGARWRQISSCFLSSLSYSCPAPRALAVPAHRALPWPRTTCQPLADTWCCGRAGLQLPTVLTSHGPHKARPTSMAQPISIPRDVPSTRRGGCPGDPQGCSYLGVGQAHGEFLREQNSFLHGPCIKKGFVPSCLILCSHLGCLQLAIPAAGGCRSQSTRSPCLAQAAPQHSLLPAGCRSCHAPCLRMSHSSGRRPAHVKSSWDRLFYELNFWK